MKYLQLLLLLSFGLSSTAQSSKQPNVLFIAVDDLNDWVGFLQGHPDTRTPNMDRLAKMGTVFSNAHCQATICAPSRASLFSGLLPSSTGIYVQIRDKQMKAKMDSEEITLLPDYFEAHGYKTLGVGKLFHNGDRAQVFEEFGGEFEKFGPKPEKRFKYDPTWFDKPGGTQTDWGAYPERDDQMPDFKIAKWAVERLQEKHEKPFFMGVGFIRPHVPWYVPKEWLDKFENTEVAMPPYLAQDFDDIPETSRQVHEVPMMPTTEWAKKEGEWENIVKAYLACIHFVDAQIGKVLDALEQSAYAENTIIVLWSDHGYHIGEKNRFAKHSLWEPTTHVPLIFAGPGIKANQTSAAPVGLIDMYPSLLELCGLPANPDNEGHSLLPLIQKPNQRWPYAALTSYGQGNHSVYFGKYHYLQYEDDSEELYHMKNDPNEWENLIKNRSSRKVIRKMKKHLPLKDEAYMPGIKFEVNEYFKRKTEARD